MTRTTIGSAGTPLLATTHVMAAVLRAGGILASDRLLDETSAEIVAVANLARAARSDTDLDRAARRLASLLMTIGADAFVRIMGVVAEKVRGGTPLKDVYAYPPPREVKPMMQERPPREAPAPRSILPTPSSTGSPQTKALETAAVSGVPFCEECAKRAAAA